METFEFVREKKRAKISVLSAQVRGHNGTNKNPKGITGLHPQVDYSMLADLVHDFFRVRSVQCCPEEFVDVTVQIRLQRESLDFVLKLIIPCSLISSMIFLGFVLPPESGERIGLSITVLWPLRCFNNSAPNSCHQTVFLCLGSSTLQSC